MATDCGLSVAWRQHLRNDAFAAKRPASSSLTPQPPPWRMFGRTQIRATAPRGSGLLFGRRVNQLSAQGPKRLADPYPFAPLPTWPITAILGASRHRTVLQPGRPRAKQTQPRREPFSVAKIETRKPKLPPFAVAPYGGRRKKRQRTAGTRYVPNAQAVQSSG